MGIHRRHTEEGEKRSCDRASSHNHGKLQSRSPHDITRFVFQTLSPSPSANATLLMDADCCLLRLPAVLAAAAAAAGGGGQGDNFRRSSSSNRSSISASSLAYLGSSWRSCLGEGIFLKRSAERWVWVRSLQESSEMAISDEEEEKTMNVGESGELFADSAENRRESSSCSSEMTSSGDSRQYSDDALPLGWPCRNRSGPEKTSSLCDDVPKLKQSSVTSGTLSLSFYSPLFGR